MSYKAVILLENGNLTSGWKDFAGGRAALVIMGTLATTTKLQMLGPDGSTAIDVSTPTTAGVTALDLPAGSYRINLSGGTPSGIYARICPVNYG